MSSQKKLKKKKCRVCKTEFQPWSSTQVACQWECAAELAARERAKKERRQLREDKERTKTRSQHLKGAQDVFNEYIRLRDELRPCISCGRYHTGQYHAGHYLSVGSTPELRFEELNVWKQCAPCNDHLSGNAINYRRRLVDIIGIEKVEWLEGPHEPKKYTIDEIKEIKKKYRQKIKDLKGGRIN